MATPRVAGNHRNSALHGVHICIWQSFDFHSKISQSKCHFSSVDTMTWNDLSVNRVRNKPSSPKTSIVCSNFENRCIKTAQASNLTPCHGTKGFGSYFPGYWPHPLTGASSALSDFLLQTRRRTKKIVCWNVKMIRHLRVKLKDDHTSVCPSRHHSQMSWPLTSRRCWRLSRTETWRTGSRCKDTLTHTFSHLPAFLWCSMIPVKCLDLP